ncbi:hypothetical protein [Nocardia pseudobrasiliensis]|uniref:hypothetical protein n=1 Tax=Nocardia pseudobrasiliensis TaxID=45979 RepID=UPI0011C038F0|nr:hypothetical protein [Nocardia pseudobrasiliensis]
MPVGGGPEAVNSERVRELGDDALAEGVSDMHHMGHVLIERCGRAAVVSGKKGVSEIGGLIDVKHHPLTHVLL